MSNGIKVNLNPLFQKHIPNTECNTQKEKDIKELVGSVVLEKSTNNHRRLAKNPILL